MTSQDWIANIDDLSERVVEKYGVEVATSVFQRYGALSSDDLSPTFYADVFSDLLQIDADD